MSQSEQLTGVTQNCTSITRSVRLSSLRRVVWDRRRRVASESVFFLRFARGRSASPLAAVTEMTVSAPSTESDRHLACRFLATGLLTDAGGWSGALPRFSARPATATVRHCPVAASGASPPLGVEPGAGAWLPAGGGAGERRPRGAGEDIRSLLI